MIAESTLHSLDGRTIRRGSLVQTDGGGIGHYVGTTSSGVEVVCYRPDRFRAACRRFDTVERGRRRVDR